MRAWAACPGGSWTGALASLARLAGVGGLAVAFLAMALGAGDAVAAPITGRRRAPLPVILALGCGTISLAVAGLGFAGLLSPLPLRCLAFAAMVTGVRTARARRDGLGTAARSIAAEPVATAAALLFAAAPALALASLPDTHEDPLVYHWAAPEAFLRAHRIYAAVQHFQWQWPLGVEMLFALGLSVAGVAGLKAANLTLLVIACAGAGAIARTITGRLDGRASGWTAVLLVALAPGIAGEAWLAKNDLGVVACWAAAVVAMLAWSPRSPRGALLAGLCAGGCASAKYTAFFPLLGLTGWFLLRRPGRRAAALAGLATLVFSGPWFARNWIVTRDPFYPLGPASLGGLSWGPSYTQALHAYADLVGARTRGAPAGIWLLAWRDAFAAPAQVGLSVAVVAPLAVIVFLPGAAGVAAVLSLAAFLLALAERDPRFLLPLAPLVAAGAELVLLAFRSARPRLAAIVWPVVAAFGCLQLALGVVRLLPAGDWNALAGRLTGPAYFAERFTADDELRRWCGSQVPADARILLAGSNKRFGFRQTVVSTHPVTCPLPWQWANEARTPRELAKKWRQAGIGYVADNLVSGRYRHQIWFKGPAWDARALALYRAFALRYFTEVHRSPLIDDVNGFYYILRVEARPHPPAASVPVLPWTESVMARANETARRPFMRTECLEITEHALATVPDVGDAMEQAAGIYYQLRVLDRALELNRALARAGFDGETAWSYLAAGESYAGRHRPAFAALRHRSAYAPYFRNEIPALVAGLYVNWAREREQAGDPAGACRLLGISLHACPGYGPALASSAALHCRPAPGSGP